MSREMWHHKYGKEAHAIDQSVSDQVVVVGELRQSQAALLLERLVEISRARRHRCPEAGRRIAKASKNKSSAIQASVTELLLQSRKQQAREEVSGKGAAVYRGRCGRRRRKAGQRAVVCKQARHRRPAFQCFSLSGKP